jgi:hypothetical protein
MRRHVGAFLRRFALYRRLRKTHEAGWAFTLRRWQTERQILRTRPVRTRAAGTTGAACEVRMLVYGGDNLMALWTTKSFYAKAGADWPLVWLQGGPMSSAAVRRLREHFPDSRFVSTEEADRAVEADLRRLGHTATLEARRHTFYLRRVIDFGVNGATDRVLFLDSDVLFFERPAELLEAVATGRRVNLFNKDANNGYGLTPDEAEKYCGVRPFELLNAGLCLICRESIRLDDLDRYLRALPPVSRTFVDQLICGLIGASFPTEHLPETYRLSAESGLTVDGRPLIARHYAGTTRRLLFTEGMPALVQRAFLEELRP